MTPLRTILLATLALGLSTARSGDRPVYEYSGKSVYPDGGKSVFPDGKGSYESLGVNRLKVDLIAAASYIYDSNTTQTEVPVDASVYTFSFGANVFMGSEARPGTYYGLKYLGQAYGYDNDTLGRDALEHRVGAFLGVNGGKTRVRFHADYYRNSGNAIQFENIDRETTRTQSNDYNFGATAVRDLPHGSLEFGTGYYLRDFDTGTGLNDGESYFGDAAWFYRPGYAPKTQVGFGLRFGADHFDSNLDQSFVTPSFRWRYALSGKTALYSSWGYEFRDVNGPTGIDSENFVYSGGVTWAASAKTRFDLGYYRSVSPSYLIGGEDYERTGVHLRMNNSLPYRFNLATQIGFENANYIPNSTTVIPSGRDDDFFRFAIDLSHPLVLFDRIRGEWGIFYHYNDNDSNIAGASFEQNITGVRVGLVY